MTVVLQSRAQAVCAAGAGRHGVSHARLFGAPWSPLLGSHTPPQGADFVSLRFVSCFQVFCLRGNDGRFLDAVCALVGAAVALVSLLVRGAISLPQSTFAFVVVMSLLLGAFRVSLAMLVDGFRAVAPNIHG